jgi:hypothetical protein
VSNRGSHGNHLSLLHSSRSFYFEHKEFSPAPLHLQTSITNTPHSTWHLFMSEEGDKINTKEAQQETKAAGDDSDKNDK